MFKCARAMILLAWATAWACGAAAQTVYRCGDSYSQQPCPGGQPVQAEDARSATQRAQTTDAVRRDAKAADVMEQARLKEEAKPTAALIPPPKAEEPQDPRERTDSAAKARKPPYFTAVSPKKPGATKTAKKKKKKTRKAAA